MLDKTLLLCLGSLALAASVCFANLSSATASPLSMPAAGRAFLAQADLVGVTPSVRLGELSAVSSALLAGPLAPLTEAALAELRDTERRPSEPYGDIDPALLQFQLESPARLPPGLLLANPRRARKGAGWCWAFWSDCRVLPCCPGRRTHQPAFCPGRPGPGANRSPTCRGSSFRPRPHPNGRVRSVTF